MQIVHGDEVPVAGNEGEGVRSGRVGKQFLLFGDPASPGNFKFGLFRQYGDFTSPRHRHNFCQFRVQIEGECDFAHDGKMKPGAIGYFPEGTAYGPQGPDREESYVATLQFGGPSGSGLLTTQQLADAKRELSKIGTFENGVFRRNQGVPGKKNMDGFEAVWEQASGRELIYPPAQYGRPVLMHPEGYRWMPVANAKGVAEKALEPSPNAGFAVPSTGLIPARTSRRRGGASTWSSLGAVPSKGRHSVASPQSIWTPARQRSSRPVRLPRWYCWACRISQA